MRRIPPIFIALVVAATPAAGDHLYLCPDVPADLTGAGTTLPWWVTQLDTTASTYTLDNFALGLGDTIDGLHRMDSGFWLVSVEAPTDLGGTTYLPQDVVLYSPGPGTFTRVFCGSDLGISVQSNIDALFLHGGDSGTLVVSFDIPTAVDTTTFDPADLVEFTATGPGCADWSLVGAYFDASTLTPPVPPTVNVNGATEEPAATLLSFDVPVTLGSDTFLAGDLVAWNGSALTLFHRDPIWPEGTGVGAISICGTPTGSIGNVLLAVKEAIADAHLHWDGATVAPPNHALYKTDSKLELEETPTGIGDETLVAVAPDSGWVDVAAVTDPPPLVFYKVLPADTCDQAVYR